MEILGIFSASFLLALSGAIVPGPLLTVNISETMQRGLIAGILIVLGHGIVELVLLIALLLGIAQVIVLPGVTGSIAVIGGLVLVWMGWGMLKLASDKRSSLDIHEKQSQFYRGGPVMKGAFVSLVNPYWLIWWATIGVGAVMIALVQYGFLGIAAFFTGHILADLMWYVFISWLIVKGRGVIRQGGYRGILACCGGFLWLMAGYFLLYGWHSLNWLGR